MCSIYSNHNSIRTQPQSALWSPWLTQRLTLFPLLLICRSENKPRTICHCTIEVVLRREALSDSLTCFSHITPRYSPSSVSPSPGQHPSTSKSEKQAPDQSTGKAFSTCGGNWSVGQRALLHTVETFNAGFSQLVT